MNKQILGWFVVRCRNVLNCHFPAGDVLLLESFFDNPYRLMRVSSKSSLQRNLPLVIFCTAFQQGWRI